MAALARNIIPILIVGIAVLGVGFAILWWTGLIYRLMDWFKPNADRWINARVFCEDKQIRDRRLKVGRYVISDPKRRRSFYLVHDLLLTNPNGSGKFLALTERSGWPLDFHNRISDQEKARYPSAQRVFIDTTADIRSESAKEATQSFMAQSLSIMALCAAIVVVILGIIVFVQVRSGDATPAIYWITGV